MKQKCVRVDTFLRSLIANIPASVQTLRISAPVKDKRKRVQENCLMTESLR